MPTPTSGYSDHHAETRKRIQELFADIRIQIPHTHRRLTIGRLEISWRCRKPFFKHRRA